MLTSTPRAPRRLTSSSSGLRTACSAAARARSLPAGRRRAHHRHPDLAHHGAHVGEVDVDEARVVDHLGDAGHRAVQHVVGGGVGVEHRDVLAEHLHQLVVGDDDQRVDLLRELLDAGLRDALPLALESERPGDDRDGQDAHALGDVGDHGRRPGAGAAAHAGGDEQHVGAVDQLGDPVAILVGGVAPDLGPGARAQAARQRRADLQLQRRVRAFQRLRVGVGADELHAGEAAAHHVVDGVAAAATDADDLDDGAVFRGLIDDFKHGALLSPVRTAAVMDAAVVTAVVVAAGIVAPAAPC